MAVRANRYGGNAQVAPAIGPATRLPLRLLRQLRQLVRGRARWCRSIPQIGDRWHCRSLKKVPVTRGRNGQFMEENDVGRQA